MINPNVRRPLQVALGVDALADDFLNQMDGAGLSGNAGTIGSGSTISLIEESLGELHLTTITFASHVVTMTDGGANGSIGNKEMYTFPQGLIKLLGARSNLTGLAASGIGATATLKHSVGSAPAATNDTLNLTKANVIPSTNTTLASSAGTLSGKSLATAIVALTDNSGGTPSDTIPAQTDSYVEATQETTVASLAGKINEIIAHLVLNGSQLGPVLDGVSSAAKLYFNLGVADAGSTGNSTVTLNGTVKFAWVKVS